MDLSFTELPKIKDWEIFQKFCCDILKLDPQNDNVNINGRLGQKQDGVDVFYRKTDDKWIGIQCKVRTTNTPLSMNELEQEINLARNFNPKIDEYCIYTTLSRDVKTQGTMREIQDKNKDIKLDIVFWEDIVDKISQFTEKNIILFKYFNNYCINEDILAHCIGKFATFTLDYSGYEVIVLKTKSAKKHINNRVYTHYNEIIFIINLTERKVGRYGIKPKGDSCFPCDIETGFSNKYDRYFICKLINKFLNTSEDIDNFINSEEVILQYIPSIEEKKEFHELYKE